jgi:hypothetical protein
MKTAMVVVVAVAVLWILYLAGPAHRAPNKVDPPPKVLTPSEDLAAAKELLASKKPLNTEQVVQTAKHLRSIAPTLPQYKEVPTLLQKLAVHQKRLAVEQNRIAKVAEDKLTREGIPGRQKYVEELEVEYLKKGYDVHLSAIGPLKTTFQFKYVLVSRPLVYQLSQPDSLLNALRSRGFKKAIFTDGYDSTWTLDIN